METDRMLQAVKRISKKVILKRRIGREERERIRLPEVSALTVLPFGLAFLAGE